MPVVVGSGPVEKRVSFTLTRQSNTFIRRWEGEAAAVYALTLVASIGAESVHYEPEHNGATAVLTAVYHQDPSNPAETPVRTNEIDTELISQSILISPKYVGIPASVRKAIRTVAEDGSTYLEATNAIATAINLIAGGTDMNDLAVEVLGKMLSGEDEFQTFTNVLYSTRYVSEFYSTKEDLSDTNLLFSTSQVASKIGDCVVFDVPDLVLLPTESAAHFVSAWRKKTTRIARRADGSREIVEQWELAKWDKDIYAVASGSGL